MFCGRALRQTLHGALPSQASLRNSLPADVMWMCDGLRQVTQDGGRPQKCMSTARRQEMCREQKVRQEAMRLTEERQKMMGPRAGEGRSKMHCPLIDCHRSLRRQSRHLNMCLC